MKSQEMSDTVQDDVRLNISLFVSPHTAAAIDRLARERNVQRTGLVLQALGLLHAAHDANKAGKYVGVTTVRDRLDTVLVAPLI